MDRNASTEERFRAPPGRAAHAVRGGHQVGVELSGDDRRHRFTADLSDLQQHFAGLGVARFEWPERLEWLADLPRTPVGKIDKKRLHTDIVAKLRAESPSG